LNVPDEGMITGKIWKSQPVEFPRVELSTAEVYGSKYLNGFWISIKFMDLNVVFTGTVISLLITILTDITEAR